jgi:hypothetical protein
MQAHCRALAVIKPNWQRGFEGALHRLVYGSAYIDPPRYLKRFSDHRKAVEDAIPPTQLLVLNVCDGEGWVRLCPFLGTAVPPEPFPRIDWIKRRL